MKFKLILFIFLGFFITSCKQKDNNEDVIAEQTSNIIEISKEQFAFAQMKVDNPVQYTFNNAVPAKGYVKVAPDGVAQVSVTISGKAVDIAYTEGQYVDKGSTLFYFEGEAIVQLQQDYAQNKAQLKLAKAEHDRLKALADENIASQKEFQRALSNYNSIKAANEGLKSKLNLINVNPKNIENGSILSRIPVLAPIDGFITKRELVQGEYIEPNQQTFEIKNLQKLKLYINVFEVDFNKLKSGQKVLFYEPDRKNIVHESTMSIIGKTIDPESKTITCIADIHNLSNSNFVDGMYAECSIVTEELNSIALPTIAIIKEGEEQYVLVKEKESDNGISFSKVLVKTGKEENGFTEIFNTNLKDVLVKGVYNLVGVE